jgi:hypothetical protein
MLSDTHVARAAWGFIPEAATLRCFSLDVLSKLQSRSIEMCVTQHRMG